MIPATWRWSTSPAAIRQATVEAMTDVMIAEFDPAVLSRLSEGCQLQIAHGLLNTLVERLALANARISQPREIAIG